MGKKRDFLGLVHNFERLMVDGTISMAVRPTLKDKVKGIIDEVLRTGHLAPGVASKLHGAMIFSASACAGTVGRSGVVTRARV